MCWCVRDGGAGGGGGGGRGGGGLLELTLQMLVSVPRRAWHILDAPFKSF